MELPRSLRPHASAIKLLAVFFIYYSVTSLLDMQKHALSHEETWRPKAPFPTPTTCDSCTDPPTILTANPAHIPEDDMKCYYPQWPTTKPRKGHSVTFMVSHLTSKNKEDSSLNHLQETFAAPDVGDRVRTIIGIIDEDAGTICVGHKQEECAPRVVLSQERRDEIAALYTDKSEQEHVDFWASQMQQTADFIGLYRLYESKCSGQDDPVLWSLLDDDMAACPGFGYHLSAIAEYGRYSLVARSGFPFALRTASGVNGFYTPPRYVGGLIDTLQWIYDRDGPQWHHAADEVMDKWATGEFYAPKHESDPRPVGVFHYYTTLFNQLGDAESYSWHGDHLEANPTTHCGMGMYWVKDKITSHECFGMAWMPCTHDKWGEAVSGVPITVEKAPIDYVDKLVADRNLRQQHVRSLWWEQMSANPTVKLVLLSIHAVVTYLAWNWSKSKPTSPHVAPHHHANGATNGVTTGERGGTGASVREKSNITLFAERNKDRQA